MTKHPSCKRRFAFGRNWQRFIDSVDDARIAEAESSLCQMLEMQTLARLRFLDIGSGSGLFSLAARRLGATVHSIDYDSDSVACTKELRQRYGQDDPDWAVAHGDALDRAAIGALGSFDIVYAWGVLHHTGAMWRALENAASAVAPGGQLFIALYNDQGWLSRYWHAVKRVYYSGPVGRMAMVVLHAPYLIGLRWLIRSLRSRGRLPRGMSLWRDMIDWLGGLPFEVARPGDVVARLEHDGFCAEHVVTCGRRHGCNQFVLRRNAAIETGVSGT